ncbi:TetR/AcrR family transcriptional regulator [Shewanella acanthi]|uniref:TetR/AcrR family transcriptional regulator n=1 Tax=Shewanella acanthi TaxID=2864212 RepID=UPI001C65CBA1|nr:TetR/AcrR family transcriptional regulator [Shewanella acanthi]QYJ78741.1 TetR/AcrR family transcriptional regulator [Shewanella acanthi]
MDKVEHNDIREAILNKAESIIAENGVTSLKISDFTIGLGISTTLFYSIFKTKEDILVALTTRAFDQALTLKWWKNLTSHSGLEKFIAYILEEFKFTETNSLYSAISTISCNKLVFQNASSIYLKKLNHLAREYWETPIQLLMQAREQQEIQATDEQIHQLCHLICTYLRGREMIDNTYTGKEYFEELRFDNARFITQLLKDLCPGRHLNSNTLRNAQELRRKLAAYRSHSEQINTN